MKHFALIGHPIGHTISPFIHNRLFKLSEIKASYQSLDIKKENLSLDYNSTLKKLDGYNVTIPHKIEILNYVNKLDRSAEICGAVNTVKNSQNISIGYNTDGVGFLESIKNKGISLTGHTVIIGAGGAACAIANVCANYCSHITLAVRETGLKKANTIVNNMLKQNSNCKTSIELLSETAAISTVNRPINILINATPIGMFPNQNMLPINESILKKCDAIFDAIYNPYETLLLKKAQANGSKTLGGLDMLVWQAVFAHKIWNNSTFKIEHIMELIEDSKKELTRKFCDK